VLAVPNRLEQAVGEPEGQDVVNRLLAEEVVDPEDLRLVEDRVHGVVQGAGGGQVRAERLFDNDPGSRDQARGPEHSHGWHEGDRRDSEVEQPPRGAAELPFGGLDRRDQRVGAARCRAGERQSLPERVHVRAGGHDSPEIPHCPEGKIAELLAGQVPAG
jgi:hypothetical protein